MQENELEKAENKMEEIQKFEIWRNGGQKIEMPATKFGSQYQQRSRSQSDNGPISIGQESIGNTL